MSRLTGYLSRQFFGEALALSAVVVMLLYLVQCLRILDVISVKGQDILTLLGQAALMIPLIGAVFLYICVGIALTRALTNMQLTGELHIIHSSRRLKSLFGAIALYAGVSATLVLGLSHVASPLALQRYDDWGASIAADLVGRALTPHRFAEIVPGVTVVIGDRRGEGQLSDFFADDTRDPEARLTYSARSAMVARDEFGYVLRLEDGMVQSMSADQRLSEIRFARHDLAVDMLMNQLGAGENVTSIELVRQAFATGDWNALTIRKLVERSSEGLRLIGMCLLMTAIAAFPSGRRRHFVPLELVVLGIAFADRGLTTYAPEFMGQLRPTAGGAAMILVGGTILAFRLWGHRLSFAPVVRRA